MRELLFRGQRVDNGRWIISPAIDSYHNGSEQVVYLYNYNGDCIAWIKVDPNTVGQWTGLVDSKGTKIFEGDIITHRNMIYSIGYKDGMLCLSYKYTDGIPHMIHNGRMECIVIGNIYDNPELLEEDTNGKEIDNI